MRNIVIGVNYGAGNDIGVYSALEEMNGKYCLLESTIIEMFSYDKYKNDKVRIMGTEKDIEKFKELLKNDRSN